LAELEVALVAPDRKVWEGQARLVVARTTDGDVGVMPGHQPILSVLEPSVLTIRTTDDQTVTAAVQGGFISVARNVVSVLAEVAELADEIDVAQARQALQEAKAQPSDDEAAAQDAKRAEARLRAAGQEV
jgi:F-type H+-transporting ATPase subunit epsilon